MNVTSALIIGGTGLLGRGIAVELVAAGWNVTILSRGKVAVPDELASLTLLTADRGVSGALGDAIRKQTFDVVVDCAAYTAEDVREVVRTFEGRVGHYFFIGTDFVYAPDSAARFPLTEDAPKLSGLPYADGKLAAEKFLLEQFNATGFPVTVLRPPHILGAGRALGCDPVAGGRDAKLLERLRAGETIRLLVDGQFLIQPVWSREVGRAIHALTHKATVHGAAMNIAGPDSVTVRHYYEMVAELIGVEIQFSGEGVESFCHKYPDKAHIARHRIYDLGRLRAAGYDSQLCLRHSMSETVAWMEKQ